MAFIKLIISQEKYAIIKLMSDQKGFAHLFSIVVILIGVIVGVYLVGQKTNLFPKASYTPSDLGSNLVAYWKMDEEIDLLIDSAGSDNNGHPQGTTVVPGIIGKGRIFNGISDYINVDTGNTFKFGSGDFSYSAWIKINSLDNSTLSGNNGRIVGDDANANSLKALIYEKGNKIAFWCRDSSGNTIHALSDTTVNDDRWHHIVGVRQGQTGLLFVDGRLVNTSNATPSSLGSCDAGASHDIGARNTNPRSLFFQGSIDEVGVWNRALSAEDVLFIYNNGQGKSYPFTSTTPNPSPSSSPQLSSYVYTLEIEDTYDTDGGLDMPGIIKKFYAANPDIFDFLAIFPDFKPRLEGFDVGYHQVLQNNVKGICQTILTIDSDIWGTKKLLGYHGFHSRDDAYKLFLDDPYYANKLILEETAHQWLTKIGHQKPQNVTDPSGNPTGITQSCNDNTVPLLFESENHWAIGLQTAGNYYGAMREARPWKDNGDGTYSFDPKFEKTLAKFHPFDLYLMGFADKSEIKDSFLLLTEMLDMQVVGGPVVYDYLFPPSPTGINTTRAKAIKLTIDDVIKIAGEERSPSAQDSQKDFKLAFVILHKKGQTPSETIVKAITAVANNISDWWSYATDNRSTMNK